MSSSNVKMPPRAVAKSAPITLTPNPLAHSVGEGLGVRAQQQYDDVSSAGTPTLRFATSLWLGHSCPSKARRRDANATAAHGQECPCYWGGAPALPSAGMLCDDRKVVAPALSSAGTPTLRLATRQWLGHSCPSAIRRRGCFATTGKSSHQWLGHSCPSVVRRRGRRRYECVCRRDADAMLGMTRTERFSPTSPTRSAQVRR